MATFLMNGTVAYNAEVEEGLFRRTTKTNQKQGQKPKVLVVAVDGIAVVCVLFYCYPNISPFSTDAAVINAANIIQGESVWLMAVTDESRT